MESYVDKRFGYLWVKANHPQFLGHRGWVKAHHLVWYRATGQKVPRGWVLHHKDGNKLNNRLKNLQLMTRAEHARLHNLGSKKSEATKLKMREAALRVAQRSGESQRRALRAKQQWREGRLGRKVKHTRNGIEVF